MSKLKPHPAMEMSGDEPEITPWVAAERRVWIRPTRPTDPSWQPGANQSEPPVSATLADLALGGLQLRSARRFEPGTLLTVRVPSNTELAARELLARVFQVGAQPDGTWTLACTLARELATTELFPLLPRRVPAGAGDQRAWVRFACNLATSYHSVVAASHDPWPATVVDLSPGGMRLRINRSFTPGALLNVELERGRGEGAGTLVRVTYCTAEDDCTWVLGCGFAGSLSDDVVRTLW